MGDIDDTIFSERLIARQLNSQRRQLKIVFIYSLKFLLSFCSSVCVYFCPQMVNLTHCNVYSVCVWGGGGGRR